MTKPKTCECGTNHNGMFDVCYRCFDDDEVMSQPTTPNEQLIETAHKLANAKYWPMEDVEKVPEILRALLEENKRLRKELSQHEE